MPQITVPKLSVPNTVSKRFGFHTVLGDLPTLLVTPQGGPQRVRHPNSTPDSCTQGVCKGPLRLKRPYPWGETFCGDIVYNEGTRTGRTLITTDCRPCGRTLGSIWVSSIEEPAPQRAQWSWLHVKTCSPRV